MTEIKNVRGRSGSVRYPVFTVVFVVMALSWLLSWVPVFTFGVRFFSPDPNTNFLVLMFSWCAFFGLLGGFVLYCVGLDGGTDEQGGD